MRALHRPIALIVLGMLAVLVASGAVVTSVYATPHASTPTTPQTPSTPSTRTQSATATAHTTTTPNSSTPQTGHTLVIRQLNGSVGYTVTVNGSLTVRQGEPSDSIAGQTATGQVGGYPWQTATNDSTDVIHFTGTLQNFEYTGGTLRVLLDGKRIDPDALRNTPTHPLPPAHTQSPAPTPPQPQPQAPTPNTTAAAPSPAPTTDSSPTVTRSPPHTPPGTTPGEPTNDSSAPDAHGESFLTQLARSVGGFIVGIAFIGGVLYVVRGRTE